MGFPALAGGALALALTLPNQHLAAHETLGRVFGDGKSPCGNGDTHSLGFPHKNTIFSFVKTLGRVFWGHKKPLREARGLTPWFSVEIKQKK